MFNLADYETVEDRLAKFWEKYPDGRIETEIIEATVNRFIVKSYLYRTEADPKPWTTGLAFEMVTDRGVNATSALENCETSSIGRSLANAGFATKGKRASREEMTKVAAASNDAKPIKTTGIISDWDAFVAEPQKPEPVQLASGVELLADRLGATIVQETPRCSHGDRILREGTSVKGKPYRGWVCGERSKVSQCDPIWMVLSQTTGEWRYQ